MESELEVKFCIPTLDGVLEQLQKNKASLHHARTYEKNLRLDTLDEALAHKHCVLRLRWDRVARCTYKGDSEIENGVLKRREIEFEVSNFEAARHFLEALGYHVSVMYEKFRTTYEVSGVAVVLDELPYGTFAEIEGPDAGSIQIVAAALRLNWEARCVESYLGLFMRLRDSRGFSAEHLSFDALQGMKFSPQDFGISYAD